MKNQKRNFITGGILLVVLICCFCLYQKQQAIHTPISASSFKLNTMISITIYDSQNETLLQEAMALCDKYEKIFSRTDKQSELYKLNHGQLSDLNDTHTISPELADLIAQGLRYCQLSEGTFDITIAPVSSLWNFSSEEKTVPSDASIRHQLPLVNYKDVILNNDQISFKQNGMGIDLGAIAKGYIADKIKEFLVSKGVKSAIINLGGNVLCIGNKPDKTPFRIGIQKPFADRNETIGTVDITDQSVVSSGIYERCFSKDGRFYHHILNPQTGYPYDNSLSSVTIISKHSTDGDGLSTSCLALGLDKGMELINQIPDTHAVFITRDGQVHYSKNFQKETSLQDS